MRFCGTDWELESLFSKASIALFQLSQTIRIKRKKLSLYLVQIQRGGHLI
jgi:hypothetical protein